MTIMAMQRQLHPTVNMSACDMESGSTIFVDDDNDTNFVLFDKTSIQLVRKSLKKKVKIGRNFEDKI